MFLFATFLFAAPVASVCEASGEQQSYSRMNFSIQLLGGIQDRGERLVVIKSRIGVNHFLLRVWVLREVRLGGKSRISCDFFF